MTKTEEPKWLTEAHLRMLHAETLRNFGGANGLRDESMLDSALGRPRHKLLYEPATSLFDLAAAYGYGVARNHPFVDGNKRTALLAIRAFLFMNGFRFAPGEIETVTMIEGLAAGTVDETALGKWIEANVSPRAT